MPSSQYGPVGDGAMRHLGEPSSLLTGRLGSVMSAVNVVYQNICWAIFPCAGTGPASPKVMPCASGGAYLSSHSTILVTANTEAGELVAPPRLTLAPTGRLSSSTRMPQSSTGLPNGTPGLPMPAMESQESWKRQPSDGSRRP